ncbi:MAG: phage holin family protein [Thermodesulfobacteriota bacterium]
MRTGLLFRWVVNALGLLFVSWLFDGIRVDGVGWAFIAALFLGIFNALVRPVLILLTLPITIVTMGLFILVINALMLWLTGALLAGFHVQGFWTAVGGALVLSIISLAANSLVGDRGRIEVIDLRRDSGNNQRWRA